MKSRYYFCDEININTWIGFTEGVHNNNLKLFKEIRGYGWKDIFSFHPNGKAYYISEHGFKYKGVWFMLDETRIGIFKYEK